MSTRGGHHQTLASGSQPLHTVDSRYAESKSQNNVLRPCTGTLVSWSSIRITVILALNLVNQKIIINPFFLLLSGRSVNQIKGNK